MSSTTDGADASCLSYANCFTVSTFGSCLGMWRGISLPRRSSSLQAATASTTRSSSKPSSIHPVMPPAMIFTGQTEPGETERAARRAVAVRTRAVGDEHGRRPAMPPSSIR